MAHNSEIQKRVRQEIHEKLGREKPPRAADRKELKYTEAVLLEIQRFATVVPNSVTHRVMKDTTLFGFDIPENTLILTNIYAVHHDPKLWADPNHFNPDANFTRHNESAGFDIINTENLIPFGVGRRSCLGESLAHQELWVFFVGLMQQFEVVFDSSHPFPSPQAVSRNGVIRTPFPFRVHFN